ncbi:putative mitochondrial protein [Phytophthora cinnamomi]|uniref:putative mitochondrial protein n=1 Tax=Phytophthora cinnamomi TaxID=4785 RepID=UPI00355A9C24|nr:putative mitochondrial protein [Phytophthora cinnamomi]
MAHDGSSDDESAFLDAQETHEDDGTLAAPKLAVEEELSPSSSAASPLKPGSPASIGRSKAVSAAAAPVSFALNAQDAGGANEALRGFWDTRRRTQSAGHLTAGSSPFGPTSTPPAAFLASPAHSESALKLHSGQAPPPPPIAVRGAGDIKSNGFMALGESLLAGMADFAGIKSPRGAIQKVLVAYPTPGPLFVDLFSKDDGTGAKVKGFRRKQDGSMADAEACGKVFAGDILVAINDVDVTKMVFADIITTAKEASFPLTLTFHCYQSNREDAEKQSQQKQVPPMERKHSSGPLPPISPSSSGGWSARLSQMTRSGSFDQRNSGADLANTPPKSPSSHPTGDANTGKFGISLGKVRNTGTDGVKSLFRIMGNKPSRPEEDMNVVKGWMNDLALKPHSSASSGGRHRKTPVNTNTDVLHSTPIVAVTTGGRFVGVLDEDVNEFALTWFRKTPPEMDIRPIKGVKRCPYFASVDDVGAILSLQCESLRFPQLKRVVEMPRPLVLDPAVGNMVDVLLEAGAGSFSATLASNEHDSFQVKISAESVSLVKISEDEGEGGMVVNADYTTFLQVLLDPADQLRFTLKVKEFGGFLDDLQQQIKDQQKEIARLKDEQVKLVAERNTFRAKSTELSRELRKLLGANNNRSLDDLQTQLAERSSLQAELAMVKAEAKRSADEIAEMKEMVDRMSDKDKGAKRLAAQNLELQRTVYQLKDSLSESKEQVDAVKKINSALASRLHRLQPETRGSVVEAAPTSPLDSIPSIPSDDEDDDDEEEEDEDLQDGIAAFRRSLVGK